MNFFIVQLIGAIGYLILQYSYFNQRKKEYYIHTNIF